MWLQACPFLSGPYNPILILLSASGRGVGREGDSLGLGETAVPQGYALMWGCRVMSLRAPWRGHTKYECGMGVSGRSEVVAHHCVQTIRSCQLPTIY